MSIVRRYVAYFMSIIRTDKEILLANFIGYGILGVIAFLISFSFLFVFSILLSSLGFQRVVQAAIPLYFIWFFPMFFFTIFIIKGFYFQAENGSDFEDSYSVVDVQRILSEGTEKEKLHLLKKLHLIDLNPDFLIAKAISVAKTGNSHKLREAAFRSIKNIKSRHEIFEKYNVRQGLVLDQLISIKSRQSEMIDETHPIAVNLEKMITVENNTNESFSSVKLIDSNWTEIAQFDKIPLKSTVDIKLQEEGNILSPIQVSVNQLNPTELFVQIGNFSQATMENIMVSLNDNQNNSVKITSQSLNVEIDEQNKIHLPDLGSKSTIGFSLNFHNSSAIGISLFAHFEGTLELSPEPNLYLETEGSTMVKIMNASENKIRIEATNIHNTIVDLQKIHISYFSDYSPTTQLLNYDHQKIVETIGSSRLLPGQTVSFTLPFKFEENEFPSFHSVIGYFLEVEKSSATQFNFSIGIK